MRLSSEMVSLPLTALPGSRSALIRRLMERLVAVGYGLSYDLIVRSFEPHQALLRQIAGFVERSAEGRDPATVRVLDVACGTGTAAFHLARAGFTVVGVDPVSHLVDVARRRIKRKGSSRPSFHHLDLGQDPLPWEGTFDVVVSLHTLYWHPAPGALLEASRRALKPRGHGVVLTYCRPASVVPTFREIRAEKGTGAAVGALRWLIPTAVFEALRDFQPRYWGPAELHRVLSDAGFDVLRTERTFLAGISLLAWARRRG